MASGQSTSGYLAVSDNHSIYYETRGNPNGIPVLVIHGGPGAGLSANYSDFFDLSRYFVVGFDQRGCGRSRPALDLQSNTTQHLLADIQRLRLSLNIEKWVLFGGSWGSTLALLAAIEEPKSVIALVLRGVFLAREEDFDWFLAPHIGASQIYPEAYAKFVEPIGMVNATNDVLSHYEHALLSTDVNLQQQAALSWYHWEEALAHVQPHEPSALSNSNKSTILSLALLEWFYISNRCFIEDNKILSSMHLIAPIPGIIIHGRCDTVCKPEAAYALHQCWPKSQLKMVSGAGHSSSEPKIKSALVQAMKLLSKV